MMELFVEMGNSYSRLVNCNDGTLVAAISHECSYVVKGAWFTEAYKSGRWDGRKRLFKDSKQTFPTGLVGIVFKVAKEQGYTIRLNDIRIKPKPSFDVNFTSPFPLRDYQLDAVDKSVKAQRGILKMATGAGKTLTALALLDRLKVKTLFIVNTKEALYDTYDMAQRCLPDEEIGVYGDGKKIFGKFLTIATMSSIVARVRKKDPVFQEENYECTIVDECLDGNTLISVPSGLRKLSELKKGDTVLTPKGTAKIKKVWTTQKQCFKYSVRGGNFLIASRNHLVPTIKRDGIIKIGDAKYLLVPKYRLTPLKFNDEDFLYGLFLGDGTCERTYIKFAFRKDIKEYDKLFLKIFKGKFRKNINGRGDVIYTMENTAGKEFIRKYGIKPGNKTYTVFIPDKLFQECNVGVIRGLFDAEGWRTESRIGIEMVSKKIIHQLSAMLKHLGIWSHVRHIMKVGPKQSDTHRLEIFGEDINRYNVLIGFHLTRKIKFHRSREGRKTLYKKKLIKHVQDKGIRTLIDIELDDEEKLFFANGVVVHNCHHVGSQTWFDTVMSMNSFYKYGLTGTAFRSDGSTLFLRATSGKRIVDISARELIDEGFLVEPEVVFLDIPFDGFDYPMSYPDIYEGGIIRNESRNRAAVDIVKKNKGKSKLIIFDRLLHGDILYEMIKKVDPGAVLIKGQTKDRKKLKEMFTKGLIKTVVASRIYNESADMPILEVVVNMAGGKSGLQVLQRIGRSLRLNPGKERAKIFDFSDEFNYKLQQHATARMSWVKKEKFILKQESNAQPVV